MFYHFFCHFFSCGTGLIQTMNFYLTLPSGSSSITYPNNTPGSYKVQLSKEVFLPEEDWEVGLATISFPDLVSEKGSLDIMTRYPVVMEFDMICRNVDKNANPVPVFHSLITQNRGNQ